MVEDDGRQAANTLDMDKLVLLDGTNETDSMKIHDILTQWFGKWFALDRDQAGTLHEEQRWADFLNDRSIFDELLAGTAIHDWVKDGLWSSMQLTASKLLPEARAELAARLAEHPTYADSGGGPTAGLTSLTFNMM